MRNQSDLKFNYSTVKLLTRAILVSSLLIQSDFSLGFGLYVLEKNNSRAYLIDSSHKNISYITSIPESWKNSIPKEATLCKESIQPNSIQALISYSAMAISSGAKESRDRSSRNNKIRARLLSSVAKNMDSNPDLITLMSFYSNYYLADASLSLLGSSTDGESVDEILGKYFEDSNCYLEDYKEAMIPGQNVIGKDAANYINYAESIYRNNNMRNELMELYSTTNYLYSTNNIPAMCTAHYSYYKKYGIEAVAIHTIDSRNINFARAIHEKVSKSDKIHLFAIGALHFCNNNILRELQSLGYSIKTHSVQN